MEHVSKLVHHRFVLSLEYIPTEQLENSFYLRSDQHLADGTSRPQDDHDGSSLTCKVPLSSSVMIDWSFKALMIFMMYFAMKKKN